MFSGTEASTVATESCFLLTILNNEENLSFNGWFPNQVLYLVNEKSFLYSLKYLYLD
jgi:hypothetical protein